MAEHDALYPRIPGGPIKKSLDKRRDKRSLGLFALAIYDNTLREAFLAREWANVLGYTLIDYGVGNNGRVILDPSQLGSKPDFILPLDGERYKIEVKFDPSYNLFTLKQWDVNCYVKHEAFVLTFRTNGVMVGGNGKINGCTKLFVPKSCQFNVSTWQKMQRLMKEHYAGLRGEMGDKPCMQLEGRKLIDSIFEFEPWPT